MPSQKSESETKSCAVMLTKVVGNRAAPHTPARLSRPAGSRSRRARRAAAPRRGARASARGSRGEVAQVAGREVVHAHDLDAVRHERLAHVAPHEPGAAGHHRASRAGRHPRGTRRRPRRVVHVVSSRRRAADAAREDAAGHARADGLAAGPGTSTLARAPAARTRSPRVPVRPGGRRTGASGAHPWHGDRMNAAPAPTEQATDPDTRLSRSVGGKLLYLFILGDVLGAGVYALVGEMAGEVGGAVWLPLLVALGL